MESTFASYIKSYLHSKYGNDADQLFQLSHILQYLVHKTKSANKGAKARGSFANLYAIYVIIEDYRNNGFDKSGNYSGYEGAKFLLCSRDNESYHLVQNFKTTLLTLV